MVCGNGGSAADAQHLSAELVGHFKRERRALPCLALTTNSSVLTAVGNDDGFAEVFERQVEAFGRKGDVLIGISTSGNSENVVRALKRARELGLVTIGLLGSDGGKALGNCDHSIVIDSQDTAQVQEKHIAIIHSICGAVEDGILDKKGN